MNNDPDYIREQLCQARKEVAESRAFIIVHKQPIIKRVELAELRIIEAEKDLPPIKHQ